MARVMGSAAPLPFGAFQLAAVARPAARAMPPQATGHLSEWWLSSGGMSVPLSAIPSPAPEKQMVRGRAERALAADWDAIVPLTTNTRAPVTPAAARASMSRP